MGVLVRQKVKGSGIWWVVVCHNKKRKYVRVGTKEAAKAAARKIEAGLATGAVNLNPPAVPTFREYADKWMEGHVRNNLKPSTQRSARMVLDKILLPAFGDSPINKIARDDVEKLCYRMLGTGRVRTKKLPDGTSTHQLERASVMGIARTLRAVLNRAGRAGIITENPAAEPGQFLKVAKNREALDVLTPQEARLFLAAAHKFTPRFAAMFHAALLTGMRQGELLALQWGDIDWAGNFISIQRANWEGHVTTPKSGKGRRVDLSDALAASLSEHRRDLAAEALKAGRSLPEWVFPSAPGGMLDAANVRRSFAVALAKAGLRQIRFHDLRHTFATWLLGNGEPITYVKDQLGHADIQMTVNVYNHVIPGANREAVNRIGVLLQNAPLARLTPETTTAVEATASPNLTVLQGFSGAGGRD